MDSVNGNYLEISTQALLENARAVVDAVDVPVIGVVKLDGYGVTIAAAARAWQQAGVTMFAVSESREALALRQAGFAEDILLMAPVADAKTLQTLLENGIILTVSDLENARFYQENGSGFPLRVHVKVDTGMGRFGIRWTDERQLQAVYAMEHLRVEGIYSHFAKSFEQTYQLTKRQLDRFLKAVQSVEQAGYSVGMRHIANSCAALRFPKTRLDAVRVGSALVGALLAPVPVPLKRVHTFYARVVARKELKKGDTTGYTSVCKMKRNTDVIVVELGQSHGFGLIGAPDPFPLLDFGVYLYHLLRWYRNPPCVTVAGKKLSLIGRVGSQYTLFDATGTDVQPGEYVTAQISLLRCGSQREFQTADDNG